MQGVRAIGLKFLGMDGSNNADSLGIRAIAACCQDIGVDWVCHSCCRCGGGLGTVRDIFSGCNRTPDHMGRVWIGVYPS